MLFLHGASRTPSLLSFLFTPLLLSLFLPVSPHLPVYQRVVTFLGLSPPSLNYVCKCLKWNVQDYKGSQVQPSLSIHRFHIFEFAYSWTFICSPQTNTHVPLHSLVGVHIFRAVNDWTDPVGTFQLRSGEAMLPSCCSSHSVYKQPFHSLFSATFFTFLCYLWWFRCPKGPQSIARRS